MSLRLRAQSMDCTKLTLSSTWSVPATIDRLRQESINQSIDNAVAKYARKLTPGQWLKWPGQAGISGGGEVDEGGEFGTFYA